MEMGHFDLDMVIQRMQHAVDIVLSSEHTTSKVAACLFDPSGDPSKVITRTNHRPKLFQDHFKMEERIGKSSQFVHAETACVLEYKRSAEGHYLCVTDPFCPNCAKTIIESGVRRVFIDHKGMEKDFVKRRAGAFNLISLKMAEEAGIDVYILHRKERRFEFLSVPKKHIRALPTGITLTDVTDAQEKIFDADQDDNVLRDCVSSYLLSSAIEKEFDQRPDPIVLCLVRNKEGRMHNLLVEETLTAGLFPQDVQNIRPDDTDKYRFDIDPMNKLYLVLKRMDLVLCGQTVYCNHVPSSRAFVNAMLTDVKYLMVKDECPDHDSHALDVANILSDKALMHIKYV